MITNNIEWVEGFPQKEINQAIEIMRDKGIVKINTLPVPSRTSPISPIYIYKITNTKNNQSYIGQTTKRITSRWGDHLFTGTSNIEFRKSIKNDDITNFIFAIEEIYSVPKENRLDPFVRRFLEIRELNCILQYDCFKNGYNFRNVI